MRERSSNKEGKQKASLFLIPSSLVASLIPPRSQKSGLQGSWSPAELIPHDHLLHVIWSRKARMRMCVAYATVASSRQMIGMQYLLCVGGCVFHDTKRAMGAQAEVWC
jgi:hypothetical protein